MHNVKNNVISTGGRGDAGVRSADTVQATKDRVMAAMLTCPTQEQAAKQAHVSISTVKNYLADPAFSHELKERRGQILQDAAMQLQLTVSPAVECLLEIVRDKRASRAYRIQAAKALMDGAIRYTETAQLAEDIKELQAWKEQQDD